MSTEVKDLELIEVPIDAIAKPSLPLILADKAFITTLKQVEAQADALKIVDAQSAQSAANLQTRLTTAGTKLEADRKAIKAPYLTMGEKIDALAKTVQARIERAKTTLGTALVNWRIDQAAKAAAQEVERQKELARLEAIRVEEARIEKERLDEIERLATEARAKSRAPVYEDDDEAEPEVVEKTETEKAIEAVRFAPVAAPVAPVGVAFKTTLVPVVVDLMQVPENFVERSIKLAALKAVFCAGWREGQPIPVCPGIRFDVNKGVASTGKTKW